MAKRFMHTATVTLRLPLGIGSDEEMAALRSAGIPVDALGNPESGHLFVRLGNKRCNIFRWFAATPDAKAPQA